MDTRQNTHQLLRLGHSWWQAETKHCHGLQQSGIQLNLNQIKAEIILPPTVFICIYLTSYTCSMFMSVWLSNGGIGQLKWKSFDIQIELFMVTLPLQLRYSEMFLSDNIEAKEYKTSGWLFTLVDLCDLSICLAKMSISYPWFILNWTNDTNICIITGLTCVTWGHLWLWSHSPRLWTTPHLALGCPSPEQRK